METHSSDSPYLYSFDPWPDIEVHTEWGETGTALASERGDLVVIVDVLSFSTTLAVACGHGATILVYSTEELEIMGGRDQATRDLNAEIISRTRTSDPAFFSLSPASLSRCPNGTRLIVTSLNGARCVAHAGARLPSVIGSLRNKTATARYIIHLLQTNPNIQRVTLVSCGEHWSSILPEQNGWRPALEDQIGAGAIVSELGECGLSLSAESQSANAIWQSVKSEISEALLSSVSGRELVEKGFQEDVLLAAEVDNEKFAVVETKPGSREFKAFH
ncbi:2-phosphosulfolactate phosphatase [Polystyrenella longa]|uniref:Probable 2-phosphosulfolactate phosphatase n=1 Tax=Polystyrenella longa TaxID=2528007 RepID=A0A518CSK8_9PLAN|nr:2-phosphosulfolactate phosphatase [Polystyrenella longa]QDU82164.1 2-phosphosulfolactate phosphatase [Polystyrenella longa]